MQSFQTPEIILYGLFIRRIFVFTDIAPNKNICFCFPEASYRFFHPAIVEAHPVHQCLVTGKTEQPWLWVAGLWPRGKGTYFYKAKTQHLQFADIFSILIQ